MLYAYHACFSVEIERMALVGFFEQKKIEKNLIWLKKLENKDSRPVKQENVRGKISIFGWL